MALEDELRELLHGPLGKDTLAQASGVFIARHGKAILAALTERKASVEVEGLVERLLTYANAIKRSGRLRVSQHMLIDILTEAATELATLKLQLAERDEALTPSAETKAAYMGEFSFVIPQAQEDEHGEAVEVDQRVYVPWTTIKEIMAAIRARALTDKGPEQKGSGGGVG
jgi:hypothetical protein